MPGIAATVILGLVTIGTEIFKGKVQSNILKRGEAASKEQYSGELAQRKAELKSAEKLTRDQMRQANRQFEENMALNREQLALTKSENAHQALRNQYSNLTNILSKNENLKNLVINRIKGLRN